MAAKPGRSSSGLAPCCAPLGFAKISENREHRTRREFWPENSRKNRKSWAWFGLHEFTISSSGPRGSEFDRGGGFEGVASVRVQTVSAGSASGP